MPIIFRNEAQERKNMPAPYSVFDICGYIIQQTSDRDFAISNLKLQKLLYFIQASFMVNRNAVCFADRIEAWDSGPVVPVAHNYYKKYAGLMIPAKEAAQRYIPKTIFDGLYVENNLSALTKEDAMLIDYIIDKTKNYSASTLSKAIFKQKPWIDAYYRYGNKEIKPVALKEFFSNKSKKEKTGNQAR